jgi:hypothetical protein
MVQPVQFELFANATPNGTELVHQWHQRAKLAAEEHPYDAFDAFTRLWFGFNNWAMRVTEADTDAEMIRSLAQSPALNRAFADWSDTNHQLRTYVRAFAVFWPIFNVKDARKKGLRFSYVELGRPEYTRRMLAAHVKHSPPIGFDRNNPTWESTIRAIYQVRCNLIHGEKGDSSEDYNIVEGAYRTLMTFIDGVNLYGWPYVEAAEPYVH